MPFCRADRKGQIVYGGKSVLGSIESNQTPHTLSRQSWPRHQKPAKARSLMRPRALAVTHPPGQRPQSTRADIHHPARPICRKDIWRRIGSRLEPLGLKGMRKLSRKLGDRKLGGIAPCRVIPPYGLAANRPASSAAITPMCSHLCFVPAQGSKPQPDMSAVQIMPKACKAAGVVTAARCLHKTRAARIIKDGEPPNDSAA